MSESNPPNQWSQKLVLLGRNPAGFSVLPDKNLLLWEQLSAWEVRKQGVTGLFSALLHMSENT